MVHRGDSGVFGDGPHPLPGHVLAPTAVTFRFAVVFPLMAGSGGPSGLGLMYVFRTAPYKLDGSRNPKNRRFKKAGNHLRGL